MSPRPSPCDGYSGDLPAYVDHELPEGRGALVDAHLEGCARCQQRLRELEGVSAVLKAWDAAVPAGAPAPQRLVRAVLARVEAAGVERRAARRRTRWSALALAASVLLAVGLPLALGLARRDARVPHPPFERGVAQAPALPKGQPLVPPHVEPLPPTLVAHAPWTGTPEASAAPPSDPAAREAFLAGALAAQRDLELERAFTLRVGIRGVWVHDVRDGVPHRMLVTPEAARAFAPDELLAWLRAKRAEPLYHTDQTGPRPLALTPGDLLREVLAGGEGTRAWNEAQALYHLGKPGTPRHVLDAWALAPRDAAAPAGPEVLDGLLAQQRGQLRLEPAPHDPAVLNAIVEGTRLPILLPAGQIITGGVTDLVVARATWLPAAPRHAVWQIPCVVVRAGAARSEAGALLTPFVAGPGLRALLVAGAEGEAVRAHVRAQWAAALGGSAPAEWSLLDLYDGATDGAALKQLGELVGAAPHGVTVGDAQGRFLGLEHLTLRGEGAAPLLARLLHGYTWEAMRRGASRAAGAGASESVEQALERLRVGRELLVEQPASAGALAPGVSRATVSEAGRAIEALRVEGQRVGVSVLPR